MCSQTSTLSSRLALLLATLLLSIVRLTAQPAAATTSETPISKPTPPTNAAPPPPSIANPLSTNLALHADRRLTDISQGQSTLIGFFNPPPFPRPRGNWFSLLTLDPPGPDQPARCTDIRVVNIHSENLSEIARRIGTKTLEMAIIPYTNSHSIHIQIQPPHEANAVHDPSQIKKHPTLTTRAYGIVTDPRIPATGSTRNPIGTNPSTPKSPAS